VHVANPGATMALGRALSTLALATWLAFGASSAHADEPPKKRAPEPNYLRALVEEGLIFTGGFIQYTTSSSNAVDHDLPTEWSTFRSKLIGTSVRFDTNHFDTNMMTHPLAGMLYYTAGRGNHLSTTESFLLAVGSSTFWEYIGEFREQASANDMIVTPISGFAIGETFTKLGMYFERSKRTPTNYVLSTMFAPSMRVHSWMDGARTPADPQNDTNGFSEEIEHRFTLRAGSGFYGGNQAKNVLADARFEMHSLLRDIPHNEEPGFHAFFLNDTSLSRIDVRGAVGNQGLRDASFETVAVPFSFVANNLRVAGPHPLGEQFLLGTSVGFHYETHAYPSMLIAHRDRISAVHFGGVVAHYEQTRGPSTFRAGFEARPEFAAVQAFGARAYYLTNPDRATLPSIVLDEGYYYAVGLEVAPSIALEVGKVTFGADARFAFYSGIRGLARDQEQLRNEASIRDRRVIQRAYVEIAPTKTLNLRLGFERRVRLGDVRATSAQESEWAIEPTLGVAL